MRFPDMKLHDTFNGKTVMVTGHTGFKGSWLTLWLHSLGAKIIGLSLDPPTSPSHFDSAGIAGFIADHRLDIRDSQGVINFVRKHQPDFVFHLAAQPLVRKSYSDPLETWQTNVLGVANVLEALRGVHGPCVGVIITSDKCYDNVEWVWGYRETDSLGGADPYSASKGAAELVIRSYVKSYFLDENCNIKIASARAGNVIGGGDWAQDRIVPDCMRAWSQGDEVELRNPHATRPWQHVLEPLSGYLALASAMSERPVLHGEAFNFGPHSDVTQSVGDLVNEIARHWDKVRWKDISEQEQGPYESGLLKLNCDKALHLLQWQAVMNFEETVKMTAEWYREYYNAGGNTSIQDYTIMQIERYMGKAAESGLSWAR
jgi:CDP-glucose 4,6-dehydratase